MSTVLHEQGLFAGGPIWGGLRRLSSDVEVHAHDFVEIAVIGTGRGTHMTARGEHGLRHGQAIVLRPGAWHGFSDCADLVVANCCLSAQALRSELGGVLQVPALRRLLWNEPVGAGSRGVAVTDLGPDAADEAIDQIGLLEADLTGARPRAGRRLGRLVTVLGILADASAPDAAAPEPHPAVAAAIARMEAAPADAWRLDDLAHAVSLDPDYLRRLFVRHVGVSPLNYLARIRAERAVALLANSDLPAARVGAAVGWDNPTYFARRFRELVGLTPTAYRARTKPPGDADRHRR
ncbi:helix-turn-helix domain-containing protein [Actinomadura algeriensis]|uniref:AraC family L-rhamnose operon transcriptional activator RhaR n=1 Tax=Actinomadura algeriensis TaxID=1679523 RepID=A0ABR9K243_9ACTN|nr:helix-turn-helix domain-containing protein [Actinomadura algeriensis]MBE1536929.1 AraC family L-rhamnose operon transcriptional activator RhaR [Actinomadura algeriensis]